MMNAFTEWDEEPIITTMDSIAAPIDKIQFPTLTACRKHNTQPDAWASIEIILKYVAFQCSDSMDTVFHIGSVCNITAYVRKDFHHLIHGTLQQLVRIVKLDKVPMNKEHTTTLHFDAKLKKELACQLERNITKEVNTTHLIQIL